VSRTGGFEVISVVRRRGADFWPCTPGFGGPVSRVGGKLHRMQPKKAPGSQQPGFCPTRCRYWDFIEIRGLWRPNQCVRGRL